MFNVKRPSFHEREVNFHAEAPFAKHDYRYRQRYDIRLAGKVWAEGSDERTRRLMRTRMFRKMRNATVGLGFGANDKFGPDETYDTPDPIKQTPDQGYYRGY